MDEGLKKITFFTRLKWAIFNLENYDFFAIENIRKAVVYFLILMIFFSLITSGGITYKFATSDLDSLAGTQNYLTEDMIQQLKSVPQDQLYISFYVASTIYVFSIYAIMTSVDIILLSILGYFTSRIIKISLKYIPIINMSVYSLTLPIILNCIYILVNSFTGFEIKYFQFMYNAVAYIYLVTAILMIRSEMIKQQIELAKITEEQEKVREELEKKEEEKEPEKPEDKEDKEKDKKENDTNGEVAVPIVTNNKDAKPQSSDQ